MTPEYASPEQVRGEPVTTATDIYSLGVILFELCSGSRPYSTADATPAEIRRAVVETPAPKPSACAADSGTARALAGDLDTIVLMAMRKEPRDRYESAAALGDDLRRHLADRPLVARQETLAHRARRFVRRNGALVAASALALIAIVGGAGLSVWQARRAVAGRALAEQRFDASRRFAVSLLSDLSGLDTASAATLRGAFGTRTAAYLDALAREASTDTTLQSDLADAYMHLGDFQGHPAFASLGNTGAALASYRKSVALLEPLSGGQPSNVSIATRLNEAYIAQAIALLPTDVTASLLSHQRALAVVSHLAAAHPGDPVMQLELSHDIELAGERFGHPYYGNLGDTARALAEIKRSLLMREEWSPRLAATDAAASERYRLMLPDIYKLMAGMLWATGDLAGAIAYQQRGLVLYEQLLAGSPSRMDYARAEFGLQYVRLANLQLEQDREIAALDSVKRATAILEPLFASDRNNGVFRRDLTRAYNQEAEVVSRRAPARARELYQQAKALSVGFLDKGPQEPEVRERLAESERGLARAAAALGDRHEAAERAVAAVATLESLVALDPKNAHYTYSLAMALRDQGDVWKSARLNAEAARAYGRALAIAAPMSASDPVSWLKHRLRDELERRGGGLPTSSRLAASP